MVEDVLLVLCFTLVFISLLMMLRSFVVFLLRSRLLYEEALWLRLHIDEIVEGLQLFQRYKRLPSYTAMTLKFWKTMGSFEREAGAIEQYYPFLKLRGNF